MADDDTPLQTTPGAGALSEFSLGEEIGQFTIRGALGGGAFGKVYECHDRDFRTVALKVLGSQHQFDQRWNRRLRDEFRLLANIEHPNLVRVHDFIETTCRRGNVDHAVRALVMEYLEGQSLHKTLEEHGPLTAAEVLPLVDGVARGLDRIHSNVPALIHRDLHPNNVFVETKPLTIRLIDFGLASVLDEAPSTTTLAAFGNRHYMAPEQADGKKSTAVDIYALGMVIVQALTGSRPDVPHRPFALGLHNDVIAQALSHPRIPTSLRPALTRALELDPEDRPSAVALLDELRAAMGNEAAVLMDIDELVREGLAMVDVAPILPPNPYETEAQESISDATQLMQRWCLVAVSRHLAPRQVDKYISMADPRLAPRFRDLVRAGRAAGVTDLAMLMVFSAARPDRRFLRP